jgi:hypothetical protein
VALNDTLTAAGSGHIGYHNAERTAINKSAMADTANVRFVSTTGSDANDGTSWFNAKLTIAAATSSLPTVSDGGVSVPTGVVHLGPGTFTEAASAALPLCSGIHYEGNAESATGWPGGTVVKLANSATGSLFARVTGHTSYNHHTSFRNICFDGNKANNGTNTSPLMDWQVPGFNCLIENCSFRNTHGVALSIPTNALNLALRTVSFSNSDDAAIKITMSGMTFLYVEDIQIDNCGTNSIAPIEISSITGDSNSQKALTFVNVKCEADVSSNFAMVRYTPFTSAGGGNAQITLIDCASGISSGTSVIVATVVESAGTGYAAKWSIIGGTSNHTPSGAPYFKSLKTSVTSFGIHCRLGSFGGLLSEDGAAGLELNNSADLAGTGSPNGVVAAPLGCVWRQTDTGRVWLKTTGTGNTGWTRLGTLNAPALTSAVAGSNAGTSPPAPVSTGATDARGNITFGTGTTPAAGNMVVVTFGTAYAAAPVVLLTEKNAATALLKTFVAAVSTTAFTVALQAAPAASQANTVYAFGYQVVE